LPNPLVKKPPQADPNEKLLAKLNSGADSLHNCPGDYTLQAIVFPGGVAFTRDEFKKLEQSRLLESAGERSEQVAAELRRRGYDAYTFHGLNLSLVAVGSFSSPQDAQIDQLRKAIAGMRVGSFTLSAFPPLIEVPKRP
jgi:hypothetical protein